MKKILCLILALALSASIFVGCGSEPDEPVTEAPITEAPLETPTDAPVVEDPTDTPTDAPVVEDPSASEPIDPNDYIVDAQDVNGMTVPEYLHIPQFTVDSEDARRINAEILEAFSSTVEWALECDADDNDDDYFAGGITWNAMYSGNSRLALVIQEEDSMGKGTYGYTVYNLDITTGKEITKEEVLADAGLTESTFTDLVEKCVVAEFVAGHTSFSSNPEAAQVLLETVDFYIASDYDYAEHAQPYFAEDGTLCAAVSLPVIAGGEQQGIVTLF